MKGSKGGGKVGMVTSRETIRRRAAEEPPDPKTLDNYVERQKAIAEKYFRVGTTALGQKEYGAAAEAFFNAMTGVEGARRLNYLYAGSFGWALYCFGKEAKNDLLQSSGRRFVQEASHADDSTAELLFYMGAILYEERRHEEASKFLEKTLIADPDHSEAIRLLRRIAQTAGRKKSKSKKIRPPHKK